MTAAWAFAPVSSTEAFIGTLVLTQYHPPLGNKDSEAIRLVDVVKTPW